MHPHRAPRGNRKDNIRLAIIAMVERGLSRQDAAQSVGISDNWLYQCLEKPEWKTYRNERMRVFRESAASRSIARVDRLADEAASEHVKLGANQLLMGIEGIVPVQRTENLHLVQHTIMPGLTVVYGGWRQHDVENACASPVIEHNPEPCINVIGKSALHPLDPRRLKGGEQ